MVHEWVMMTQWMIFISKFEQVLFNLIFFLYVYSCLLFSLVCSKLEEEKEYIFMEILELLILLGLYTFSFLFNHKKKWYFLLLIILFLILFFYLISITNPIIKLIISFSAVAGGKALAEIVSEIK